MIYDFDDGIKIRCDIKVQIKIILSFKHLLMTILLFMSTTTKNCDVIFLNWGFPMYSVVVGIEV